MRQTEGSTLTELLDALPTTTIEGRQNITIPQDFLPNEPTPVRVRSYLIRRGAVVAALDKDANAVSKEVHDAYAACVTCPELDFPHELTEAELQDLARCAFEIGKEISVSTQDFNPSG